MPFFIETKWNGNVSKYFQVIQAKASYGDAFIDCVIKCEKSANDTIEW